MVTGLKLCLRLACAVGIVLVTRLNSLGDTLFFTNSSFITINDSNNPPTIATPWPSVINVSNLNGRVVSNLTVTLNGLSHTFPSDISILLVGPAGQAAVLMSTVGGDQDFPVTDLTISLNDLDPDPLPILDALFSGGFHPTARQSPLPFAFPSPAPVGNSNAPARLSVFNNTDPNGPWSLFVVDDVPGDDGSISGGWTLQVDTGIPLAVRQAGTNIVFSWPVVTNQTFNLQTSLNLSNPNGWSNVVGTPAQVGGQNILTNGNSNQLNKIKYYRLIGP